MSIYFPDNKSLGGHQWADPGNMITAEKARTRSNAFELVANPDTVRRTLAEIYERIVAAADVGLWGVLHRCLPDTLNQAAVESDLKAKGYSVTSNGNLLTVSWASTSSEKKENECS